MKYKIAEHVIIGKIQDHEIRDIIYYELSQEELLLAKLKDPKLAYWAIDEQGIKRYYQNNELQVTIDGDNITRHSILSHLKTIIYIIRNLHIEYVTKYNTENKGIEMNSKPHLMKTMGAWTWNSESVNAKVDRQGKNDCWPWLGSQSPSAPLFGARKNNLPQMTQAARILYRDWFNEDCEDREITHACGNKNCMNPEHWEIRPVKKRGPRRRPFIPVKQAKLKEIKKKDWFK